MSALPHFVRSSCSSRGRPFLPQYFSEARAGKDKVLASIRRVGSLIFSSDPSIAFLIAYGKDAEQSLLSVSSSTSSTCLTYQGRPRPAADHRWTLSIVHISVHRSIRRSLGVIYGVVKAQTWRGEERKGKKRKERRERGKTNVDRFREQV